MLFLVDIPIASILPSKRGISEIRIFFIKLNLLPPPRKIQILTVCGVYFAEQSGFLEYQTLFRALYRWF